MLGRPEVSTFARQYRNKNLRKDSGRFGLCDADRSLQSCRSHTCTCLRRGGRAEVNAGVCLQHFCFACPERGSSRNLTQEERRPLTSKETRASTRSWMRLRLHRFLRAKLPVPARSRSDADGEPVKRRQLGLRSAAE